MNWLFYLSYNFIVYSFLGWCLEELYCFVINGVFRKDNFLIGPFKPMYGFAAVILIFAYEYLSFTGISLGILCVAVPTVIEYITGYTLIRLFNKRYWDYNDNKFNFKGIICLKFSLYWGIISQFIIYIIHPVIEMIYFKKYFLINKFTPVIIIYLIFDLLVKIKLLTRKEVQKS